MRPSSCALLALAIALTACGEPPPELREWQPSDHQPPGTVDPAATGRAVAPPDDAQDPAQTEIRAATALFGSLCASCHGPAGRGDGPGRPPVAQVADLTTAVWQSERTDAQIAEVIREGSGGFMPAFGDRLSPAGVDALVRHVRRLGGAQPAPAADAPAGEAAPGADVSPANPPAPADAPADTPAGAPAADAPAPSAAPAAAAAAAVEAGETPPAAP